MKRSSPVRSRTGDPLRRDFADQETVAWTADVLLPDGGVLYRLRRQEDGTMRNCVGGSARGFRFAPAVSVSHVTGPTPPSPDPPDYRGFVADVALHHVLVRLALHGYGALADAAADDRSAAAAVRAALRRVGRRRLAGSHRAGERRQTWREGGAVRVTRSAHYRMKSRLFSAGGCTRHRRSRKKPNKTTPHVVRAAMELHTGSHVSVS